jgi:hypothetical protein
MVIVFFNSFSVCSMFVLFWSYIIDIFKQAIICCSIRIGYICFCSMCCIYVSANFDDVDAQSVCSIVGRFQSNLVPSLFVIYVIFLFWILLIISRMFCSMLLIMFMISIFGMLVYKFSISKEQISISFLSSVTCESVIRWLELRTLYVYGMCR